MLEDSKPARWLPFVATLERKVSAQVFQTWFRPLQITDDSAAGIVRILAPNQIVKDWVIAHYGGAIQESLGETNLATYRIEWLNPDSNSQEKVVTSSAGDGGLANAFRAGSESPGMTGAAVSSPVAVKTADCQLNQKYTFASFVVAPCNRFAHAAAQAVAEVPGKTYNPLYLYGGVGLGKTHLIQAMGHLIQQSRPGLRFAYLSLERFMNELINAIRYGYDKTQVFRERYRTIDVLLIDDIQFIAGKERTQEEFFHTFNALYDAQKQIVMTSDCPPREIPEIEERLHSRFEWGLIADIEPPDLETKIAILTRNAELQNIDLPADVALFLAMNSKRNIRELEGSFVRLLAMASLRGVPLSKALAEDSLGCAATADNDGHVSIARIQKAVASYYKITVDNLRARSNARQVLVPRQVAMYLCKQLTKKSYPEIARQFGGKHHTTVMHSVEKIDRLINSDPVFSATVKRLSESSVATCG